MKICSFWLILPAQVTNGEISIQVIQRTGKPCSFTYNYQHCNNTKLVENLQTYLLGQWLQYKDYLAALYVHLVAIIWSLCECWRLLKSSHARLDPTGTGVISSNLGMDIPRYKQETKRRKIRIAAVCIISDKRLFISSHITEVQGYEMFSVWIC